MHFSMSLSNITTMEYNILCESLRFENEESWIGLVTQNRNPLLTCNPLLSAYIIDKLINLTIKAFLLIYLFRD